MIRRITGITRNGDFPYSPTLSYWSNGRYFIRVRFYNSVLFLEISAL